MVIMGQDAKITEAFWQATSICKCLAFATAISINFGACVVLYLLDPQEHDRERGPGKAGLKKR
jgi:hypothetical protein